MFVRIKEVKGKLGISRYAYLIENEWNSFKKKREQKQIANLGNVADLPVTGTIEKIVTALDTFARKQGLTTLSNGLVIDDISQESFLEKSYDWGELLLTQEMMKKLSLHTLITLAYDSCPKSKKKLLSFKKFEAAIQVLIAHRLHNRSDASERESSRWYTQDVFIKNKQELKKDDYYRALDILIEEKDAIEQGYFEVNRNLFSQPLELVLFDTTSIYYYGSPDPAGENDLLQFGYSKDGKKDLKQVMVGVLMTGEGVPIAHEVFPGNTSDQTSFRTIVKSIQAKYQIERVILVGDRGMVSEGNLKVLDEEGLEYILGVKMRQVSGVLKDFLLGRDEEDMEQVHENLYTYDLSIGSLHSELQNELMKQMYRNIGVVQSESEEHLRDRLKKRRYVVCYNPRVAKEQKKKREHFRQIIKKKVMKTTDKEWLVKNGYKKYVDIKKIEVKLNEAKLEKEEIYDGLWILMTNVKADTISASTISSFYKTLQFVERGFRDLKSLITVQPIFHFKEERIKAHIFVCFLSLIIKWYIFHMLDKSSQIPGKRFLEKVCNLKAIAVDKRIPLYLRTSLDEEMKKQIKMLGMKVPDKVIVDGRKKTSPLKKVGRPRKKQEKEKLFLF